MGNLAVHMRITNIQVQNEDVDSRNLAIQSLVSNWSKNQSASGILIKAAQIADALGGDGTPDPILGEEVEKAVQEHASAFLYSERPLEVGICAGVAILNMISARPEGSGWLIQDIFAVALWSALEFQEPLREPKREALRVEVLELVKARTLAAAEESRKRLEVLDFTDITISANESKYTSTFKKSTTNTITALRRNAALDREELDFLWWALSARSRLLNRPHRQIAEPVRLVAAGVEAADHVRRFPAQVHRELVLGTLDQDPSLDLESLIEAMGSDRETIANHQKHDLFALAPSVFPLMNSLKTGTCDCDGGKVSRTSSDWGGRALLEASLAQISVNGIGTI